MSIYKIDEYDNLVIDNNFNIQKKDPSLNGMNAYSMVNKYKVHTDDFNELFFSKYGLNYITQFFFSNGLNFQVVTHPYETNTCFEKARLLDGWNPLNIIKTLYFEYSVDNSLYAVVIPETGCFIDKSKLKKILDLPIDGILKKADKLPKNMSFGTCSPFVTNDDFKINGGPIAKIIFDSETLEIKKNEKKLDDFSFGNNHRMSLQMNYYDCYTMLKFLYPDIIEHHEILSLSFKEKFSRKNGRVCIDYEFNSLNYKTASFINSIHGYGDVTIINDYVDELNLPDAFVGFNNNLISIR